MPSRFRWSWVLADRLAVGSAPLRRRHLDALEAAGIRSVLSLCSEAEAPRPEGMEARFRCLRQPLPDHHHGRPPELEELLDALAALERLQEHAPVLVHCVAGMERSPLLVLAWLQQRRRMAPRAALAYLMEVHPGTSPLPEQLALLRRLPDPGRSMEQ